MIRKRIEIVSRLLAGFLGLASVFPLHAQRFPGEAGQARPPQSGGGVGRIHAAEAFRVRAGPDPAPMPLPPALGTAGTQRQAAPRVREVVPDIPYGYFWKRQDGLRLRSAAYARGRAISEHSPGLLGAFDLPRVATPGTKWLPAPPPLPAHTGNWSFGSRNWQTRLDEGPRVSLGSSEIAVPDWNESVRLGGISLNQSFLAGSDDVARWNYSLAFGAVDQSAAGTAGDLVFGPTAGSLGLSYDYSPGLSMSSRTEVAGDLVMSDLVGQYDLGGLGRWRSGVARSTQGLHQGWRYRAMADFDLARDVRLAWMGERHTAGFMDIRRYADRAVPAAGARQRWSASWDVGRWGEWSGSLESVHGEQGVQQRRFGVSQQFWYSPNLRIGIHAEREVIAGDYDIGLRFSFPLY